MAVDEFTKGKHIKRGLNKSEGIPTFRKQMGDDE